jgi:Cu2+-exporting ATPase
MFADTAPALFAPSATAQVPCTHCGQPVVTEAGAPPAAIFCCAGCASVYSILNDAGLSDFYQKRGDSGASPAGRAIGTSRTYADFDQPEFVKLYCKALPLGCLGTELFLENVHCAACVWLVEKITAVLPGVTEARLDVSRGVLRVAWDPVVIGLSRIASWLDSIGYPCHPLHGVDREAVRRREDRALLMRLGVAGAAAGNAMLLAVAMYCGAFSGIDADYVELFRWGSVLVAVPSVLWCAGVFYRGALSALRTRTPHMDLPVSVGIVVGSADGVVNTLRAHGEIYFDTITMLVFLLLVGRYLQQRAQRRADRTSEQLSSLGPSTARLLDGSAVREVPAETVPIGAVVEVRTGEPVPVDGVVLDGASSIDSSFLTGESMPGAVREGDRVHAGTVNLSGRLVVRAEKTGRGGGGGGGAAPRHEHGASGAPSLPSPASGGGEREIIFPA